MAITAPKTPIENTGINGGMDPSVTLGTLGQAQGFLPMPEIPADYKGPIASEGGIMADPMRPGGPWGGQLPWAISQAPPPIDPSRYDPSKTFDDYYRDYHAPDRDAVLRGYPGMGDYRLQPMKPFTEYLQGNHSPSSEPFDPSRRMHFNTLGSLGMGAGSAFGGALGGLFGGGGTKRPGGPSLSQGLASIITPGGRQMNIPQASLQEALRRGARMGG